MRERRGSFEIVLAEGQHNVLDAPEGGASYTRQSGGTGSSGMRARR